MKSKAECLADTEAHFRTLAKKSAGHQKELLIREADRAEEDYEEAAGRTLTPLRLRKKEK